MLVDGRRPNQSQIVKHLLEKISVSTKTSTYTHTHTHTHARVHSIIYIIIIIPGIKYSTIVFNNE